MISARDVDRIVGATATGADGVRIGTVTSILTDDHGALPSWAVVRMEGRDGAAPLDGATWDGESLHVAVTRDALQRAPQVTQTARLGDAEQRRLREHYGVDVESLQGTPAVSYSVHADDADASAAGREPALR